MTCNESFLIFTVVLLKIVRLSFYGKKGTIMGQILKWAAEFLGAGMCSYRYLLFTLMAFSTVLFSMEHDKQKEEPEATFYFSENDKRSKEVSYIYYPSQEEIPFGHAGIEVEGTLHTLMLIMTEKRNFASMAEHSKSKGMPFFRYVVSVTPEQYEILKNGNEMKSSYFGCSQGACNALSRGARYWVPMPISLSPLCTSLYLTTMRALGSKRIKRIEFYGNKSATKNILKSTPGILSESVICLANIILALILYNKMMDS